MDIPKKDKERAKKLSSIIDYHRGLYHEKDSPEISDEAYDALVSELLALEEKYPNMALNSPTSKVGGAPVEKFTKVKHIYPQYSYNNVFDFDELTAWEERLKKILSGDDLDTSMSYVCEEKIDGLKIIVTYKGGELVLGATRGDGEVGEDITHSVMAIDSIPKKLNQKVDVTVVGEAWMKKSDLLKLNKEREKEELPLFANTRNAAAGSLRQLDPSVTRSRNIQVFFYSIENFDDFQDIKTQKDILLKLSDLGLPINKNFYVAKNIDEVEKFYQKENDLREDKEYGVDGIVIKVSEVEKYDSLGYTSKAPRFGIAYKFKAEETTTVLEKITVQVGRTGAITPVAELRPVRIAGSLVSRATLHNEEEIERLDVKIGDTVILRKAGDVIPEIVSVLKDLRTGKEKSFKMPKNCPICGSLLEKKNTTSGKVSAAWYCTNKNCYKREIERLKHFVSKKGANIVGFGEKQIERFYDLGLIDTPESIYRLKTGDIDVLERFGEKSAENLVKSIDESRKIELNNLLYAIGILHIGEEGAEIIEKEIFQKWGSKANDYYKILTSLTFEDIESIYGIGEEGARSFVEYFSDKKNQEFLKDLFSEIEIFIDETKFSGSTKTFSGKTFVLTGTLPTLSRDEAKDLIKKNGGKVTSSVSKLTDFVLLGENPGSKLDDAKKLGVKTISEAEFLKLVK